MVVAQEILVKLVQAYDASFVPHHWQCATERGEPDCDCGIGDLHHAIEAVRVVVGKHGEGRTSTAPEEG